MKFFGNLKLGIQKAKQHNIVLLLSVIYNFVWAVLKIFFGVFSNLYFFCVSGASTLLLGFIKRVYLKNYNNDDFNTRNKKCITIGILLIITGVLYASYMSRLFFTDTVAQYGLILSITIATFSFGELGISIYNFIKAKKSSDLLKQSFRGCTLASSFYAISLTQLALLSATKTSANNFNAIIGVVAGMMSVAIATYILIKASKNKSEQEYL